MTATSRHLSCCGISEQVNADPGRNAAEIVSFPKAKLPPQVDDLNRSCARLIWATFPGRSQAAVCEEAAQWLGVSPDTIDRILSLRTKHPDLRVMCACLAIYQTRTGQAWPIGGGFEIRITQASQ